MKALWLIIPLIFGEFNHFNNGSCTKQYNSLNLVYVDNSGAGDSPLGELQYLEIESKVEALVKSEGRFLLYLSNGKNPGHSEYAKNASRVLTSLRSFQSQDPDLNYDRREIVKLLLYDEFQITTSLNFYFFMNRTTLNSMLFNSGSMLVSHLASDISFLTNFVGKEISFHFFVQNPPKDLKQKLESCIHFSMDEDGKKIFINE